MSEKIRAKIAANLNKVAKDMDALEKDLDTKIVDPLYQKLSMDMEEELDLELEDEAIDDYDPAFYEEDDDYDLEASTDFPDVKEEPIDQHNLEILDGGSEVAPYIHAYVRMSAYLDKCADQVENELKDVKLAREIDEVADSIDEKIAKLKNLGTKTKVASSKKNIENMIGDIQNFLKGDWAKDLKKSDPEYIKHKKEELDMLKKKLKEAK